MTTAEQPSKKVCLVILDGWGHGRMDASNAIFMADTSFMDSLYRTRPNAELRTDGENVGLPQGQMGNSEVGHMNIGAGRIVYQELVRINKSIEEGDLFSNTVLKNAFAAGRKNGSKVHLIGLVSDGGVHSHIDHLIALSKMAVTQGAENVFVHAITDGRDTDPKSGQQFIDGLEEKLKNTGLKIASVIGRYYAMDRDKRWERVAKAYDLLVHGTGTPFSSASSAMVHAYDHGITDEFIEPAVIVDEARRPLATIGENDVVICFNFRTDRCREITQVLTQQAMHEFNMHPLDLHYVTMTRYDESFENIHVVFEKDNLENTLGQVLADHGKTQIRIAETEKYPHVTFFFNGGREQEFIGEQRIMVNSPKVATYDLQPEMSAPEVTEKIIAALARSLPDFICLNFANADMVGHTGVFPAIVKAVETVDECLRKVAETGLQSGYSFIIIADHGNADFAVNDDGTPNTAHTTNPVPVIILDDGVTHVKNGILADIAPTVLDLMGVEAPTVMTGKSLIR